MSTDQSAESREVQLAVLLTDLSDRAQAGEAIDIERVATEYEELGEEIRELWGAVMLASALGSHVSSFEKQNLAETEPSGDDSAAGMGLISLPTSFGDYELLEELGRGGMGVVYKARQLSLDRTVAVKMILREQSSEDDIARFRAEAEAAARLDHPGIVPVYEVGDHDGRPYFSMKYIEGRTLSQLLSSGPLSSRYAAEIMAEVAAAIEFAHRHGVMHRDLKPSNIFVDQQGRPHVTDFGLAKRVEEGASLTKTGAVLGTPAYMSPEQAAGRRGQMGPASDIYSLGAVLYHILTGRQPVEARSPVEAVMMVLEQDPPPPHAVNPKIDRDVEMIALRCLQKPPDLRYESAGSLADDLRAYLHDEPISARSGRFTQIVSRWFRETHHAAVLENWGLLWMWHSLALIVVCFLTNALELAGVQNRLYYFGFWTAGLGTWAAVFWALRRRMGPVTFVERQIAHVWAASMISIAALFPVEYLLGLPVLTLSPALALAAGSVFLVKAAMLSGAFYVQAITLYLTALLMATAPLRPYAHFLFGIVSAACFFFPGRKYFRQRRGNRREERERKVGGIEAASD